MTIPATPEVASPSGPAALLPLLWLSSPALPVGAFSYSEGLEAAVEAGIVTSEDNACEWLRCQIHLALARSELPASGAAHAAWVRGDAAELRSIQAWVLATRESAELRRQTEQMGRSMLAWVRQLHPGHPALAVAGEAGEGELSWPVAFALAAHASGLDALHAGYGLAFSWLESQVQAALRVVPLGQAAGQRLLHALLPEIPAAVAHALRIAPDRNAWQSFSPMLAILSARHETQYSRLFRS